MKKTTNHYRDDLLQLSSSLSKMMKRKFGKGPETCFVTLNNNKMTVYIRNFITPAEEALVEKDKVNLAHQFRSAVMDPVLMDFKEEVWDVIGISFDAYYADWDYDINTGIVLLEDLNPDKWGDKKLDPYLKETLFEQILDVCSGMHKVPHKLEMEMFHPNLYVVECQGALLEIEKVLFEKGQLDVLQERSREIKRNYLKKKDRFGKAIGRPVESLFTTWDYINDRCHIFFSLK